MDNIECDNCNKIAYEKWQFTGKYELLKGECFIHPKRTNIIQPERSKREDYIITTINSDSCPKIEMPIDKDILTKYKWDSIDAVL